uniref:Uncharacterized protein n=1 Tax=Caenorhabditis tropicalis TaxID=1561998 RepID=A0A1I7U6Y1_9PELO
MMSTWKYLIFDKIQNYVCIHWNDGFPSLDELCQVTDCLKFEDSNTKAQKHIKELLTVASANATRQFCNRE